MKNMIVALRKGFRESLSQNVPQEEENCQLFFLSPILPAQLNHSRHPSGIELPLHENVF